MARRTLQSSSDESREATLLRRARKHVVRGEARQAMLVLREACFATEDPRLWARYGVQCWRVRKHEDAANALRQAIWLHERAPDDRRSGSLRGLLVAVEAGRSPDSVRAA